MPWGIVEVEPEVADWLRRLAWKEFGRALFAIDLLEDQGVALDAPYTRQLSGKLRELRFYLGRQQIRISYFVASERRIVLLTVFRKQQRHELREIRRAEAAMARCLQERHTAEDENGDAME